MNEILAQPITDMGDFLVHALELEVESAERYRELADSMEVHNNPEVAELFLTLAGYGDLHVQQVHERCDAVQLPVISPWDFKWACPESPETPCADNASYLMNRCQALELALHNEIRGHDFYAEVAHTAADSEVRRIAAQMADEESSHVEMLKVWIAREQGESRIPREDLDPPNIPE